MSNDVAHFDVTSWLDPSLDLSSNDVAHFGVTSRLADFKIIICSGARMLVNSLSYTTKVTYQAASRGEGVNGDNRAWDGATVEDLGGGGVKYVLTKKRSEVFVCQTKMSSLNS